MKGEIWKDIEGYEGKYQVSNYGRVKSLERTVRCDRGYRIIPERIRKARKNNYGYLQLNLYKDGKIKSYKIHRLVAQAFLENSDNLPEVNHIDENKQNNYVENLEWCSKSYNMTYNGRAKKVGKKLRGRKQSEEHIKKVAEKMTNNPKLSKPVIGINKISGLIVGFPSTHEAERQTGIYHGNFIACLKGKYKSAGGYVWFYANDEDAE